MPNFLKNRKFLTLRYVHVLNPSFSEWQNLLTLLTILSSSLFNIFINDIFLYLQECDLSNYDDDSTMYTSNKSISNITNPIARSSLFCRNGFATTSQFSIQMSAYLRYQALVLSFKLTRFVEMELLKRVNKKSIRCYY